MAFMSGIGRDLELSEIVNSNDNIYLVKVVGQSTAKIKEMLEPVAKIDPALADFPYFTVEVVEVLHVSNSLSLTPEDWTYQFPGSDATILKNCRAKAGQSLAIGDRFFILNSEDALYSVMYYVQGLRKIVYYNHCNELAQAIEMGKTYLFAGTYSLKNAVFYGCLGLGLFAPSAEMQKKLLSAVDG